MLSSYLTALSSALTINPAEITAATDAHGRHTLTIPVSLIAEPLTLITAHEGVLAALHWGVFTTHEIREEMHHLTLMPHLQPV